MLAKKTKKWKKFYSPERAGKILEGKAEIAESERLNESLYVKVYELFKRRKTIEDGFSSRELSHIIYPEIARLDIGKAMRYLKTLLNLFNKKPENKSVQVFGDIQINEEKKVFEWILYRITNKTDAKKVDKRLDKSQKGYQSTRDKLNSITSLTKAQLERLDREQEEKIRAARRKREKKS